MVKYTISELLKKGIDILGEGDYFNPLLDAQILLSFLLDVDKIYLYTHNNELVDSEVRDEYLRLIELRRQRFPLQYITGTQEFMGLDFNVEENVLIPRPDTETLIESVLEIVEEGYFRDNLDSPINIVDIGTGSGAVTLSLLHFIENSFAYSVDISDKALEVAKKNSKTFSLDKRVKFLKGNMLQPLADENLKGKVDILVSNPPYIPSDVIDGLQIEVSKHEPRLALDGGLDGLDFYREIISGAKDYLSEKSIIAFEIGFDQGESVCELLRATELFEEIMVIADLSGNDRVVIGKKD